MMPSFFPIVLFAMVALLAGRAPSFAQGIAPRGGPAGDVGVVQLLNQLRDTDPAIRERAIDGLAKMGNKAHWIH
jgi:hypothetical protein